MVKQRIKHEEIIPGRPLPFSIYDDDGNLLLTEGSVIESDFQLNTLLERGLYCYRLSRARREESPQTPVISYPFETIDEIYTGLNLLLGRSIADPKLPAKILKLCSKLQDACEHDTDACLGMIAFGHYYKYPIMHSIHTALVCKTVLKRLGWLPEQRLMPMAAAMTMNISMIELQDKLYSQRAPLSGKQKVEILDHPGRSVEMLEKCGVRDELWLHTIIQHHELLDGSGYPSGQKEDSIVQSSRVVTLGDVYGARISNRSYRKPILPTDALRDFFVNKGQCLDQTMSKILIKNLGLFPPGSFVELSNGEIAVVTRVGKDARHPEVASVVGANGKRLSKPAVRNTAAAPFEIKKILTKNEAGIEVNRYQLWGYMRPEALSIRFD